MDKTKSDFNKRKEEINEYFLFLEILNSEKIYLKYTSGIDTKEVSLSTKLQRIFIANTFLILYNLIESTIRNSIVEIYDKIQEDEVKYDNLSDNLKQIWLQKMTKRFNDSKISDKSITNNLHEIIKNIIEHEIIALTKDDIDISGNIDAREIRKLANKIGFNNTQNGSSLVTIKNKRNGLAHGDFTFYDVGKNYTIAELNNFKDETFSYLLEVVNNIELFISKKVYLKQVV